MDDRCDSFGAIELSRELEPGEIEQPKEQPEDGLSEANVENFKKIIAGRRHTEIRVNRDGQKYMKDTQIKQFSGSRRAGFKVLMTLENCNKSTSDPNRLFSVLIQLRPPSRIEAAEIILFAYLGKHFECDNHILRHSHSWRQIFAVSKSEEVSELLDDLEGKEWD